MSAGDVLRLSPIVRRLLNEEVEPVHPEDPTIRGVSHVMWTGKPRDPRAHARNAVFYGDKAIDRSPCGTGTSARMAQLAARGRLEVGDDFVHESIIGTLFEGRVEGAGARRQPRRHRALDRRLGAPARHQHDLRRRARSLRARLPGLGPQASSSPASNSGAGWRQRVRKSYSAAFAIVAGGRTPPREKMASISAAL